MTRNFPTPVLFMTTCQAGEGQEQHFISKIGQRCTNGRHFDRGAQLLRDMLMSLPFLRHRRVLERDDGACVLRVHASAGFSQVKKNISNILNDAGLL